MINSENVSGKPTGPSKLNPFWLPFSLPPTVRTRSPGAINSITPVITQTFFIIFFLQHNIHGQRTAIIELGLIIFLNIYRHTENRCIFVFLCCALAHTSDTVCAGTAGQCRTTHYTRTNRSNHSNLQNQKNNNQRPSGISK